MTKNFLFISFVLALGACNDAPGTGSPSSFADASPIPVTMRGYLYQKEEKFSFKACDNGTTYALTDSTPDMQARFKEATSLVHCPGEPVYASIKGLASPGNKLVLTQVDSLAPLSKLNACHGFDYACSGTEPFWSVLISSNEQVVYFKDLAAGKGYTYAYAAPTSKDGVLQYIFPDITNPYSKLAVTIKKEPCSDGMSDKQYQYSCMVIFDRSSEYKGCAEKSGELVPGDQ
jgi:uncharacterized membrane protein